MKLHPAAQILTWCMMVAALQMLSPGKLLMASSLILLAAFYISGHKYILLLRRTRWVLLSLLLVYAYSTPGQALLVSIGIFSPTREGLTDGVLQLTRLMAAIAGLAILLDRLHRQKLIAGLYPMLAPLKLIGVSRERVAVRLALTLHYAEVAMLRESHSWQDNLHSLFQPHDETSKQMELILYRFGIYDGILVGLALLLLFGAMR
jgi:energy-coupling factor transporter transmembrane protein EcfT